MSILPTKKIEIRKIYVSWVERLAGFVSRGQA